MTRHIAVYGKGGIGKSTIASHTAAALGLKGFKVALLGCDPKKDSTFLLVGNRNVKTVLDALRRKEDIKECIINGFANVKCLEIGGPEPGIGCAGRGLTLAFEHIEKEGVFNNIDIVIYDVPGDIVCGGFAVPMKKALEEVYIVTSGEYLSLYAANNICKAAGNIGAKLGGIILNSRFDLKKEYEIVNSFAKMIGSRVIGVLPYIMKIRECEAKGKTLFHFSDRPDEAEYFIKLAEEILKNSCKVVARGIEDEKLLNYLMDINI